MIERRKTLSRWLSPVLLGALAFGCAQAPKPTASEDVALSTAPVAEQPKTRPTPMRVMAVVDWKSAAAYRRVSAAVLPGALRSVLTEAPVPALVPRAPSVLSRGKATRGASWYALSMPLEEHTVFITGNNAEVFVPGVSDNASPRAEFDPRITRTRGIVSAAFNAFGVAYVVEVECQSPFDDPRCTKDEYVRSLVDDLAIAGGAS
jgi:hypothetical protein